MDYWRARDIDGDERAASLADFCRRVSLGIVGAFVTLEIFARFSFVLSGTGWAPHEGWLLGQQGARLTLLVVLPLVAWVLSRGSDHVHIPKIVEKLAGMISLAILVASSLKVTPFRPYDGLWSGFGRVPTMAALVLAVSLTLGLGATQNSQRSRFVQVLVFSAAPLILIAPRMTLFLQPSNGLINLDDTTYHVLDELLAPIAGGMPYGNYTPQYSGMLGWILVPARFLVTDAQVMMHIVIAVTNLLNLLVPLLVVAIVRLLYPKMRRIVTFTAFVGIWTICGTDLGYSTQIREFSHFARYVPSLFALWLVLRILLSRSRGIRRYWYYLGGVSLGLAALNSADHGLTLSAGALIALLIPSIRREVGNLPVVRLWLGFLVAVATYALILFLGGQHPSVMSYLGLRSTALSGDVYELNGALQPVGPHFFVLIVPVILLSLSSRHLATTSSTEQLAVVRFFVATITFWSLSLCVKLVLKTSYVVETPAYFVTAFLGGVVMLHALGIHRLRGLTFSLRLRALPVLFLCCLPIAAVYPTANVNVQDELRRIFGDTVGSTTWSNTFGRQSDSWTYESLSKSDDLIDEVSGRAAVYRQSELSVGYFGVYGNSVELLTGVENTVGIASTESLRFGESQERLACVPVNRMKLDVIVVYGTEFPCENYLIDTIDSTKQFKVFRRVNSSS